MEQAKHTPGQWFINRESSDCHDGKLSIEVDGDYFIAQVDEGVCQEANARLIAAAPELLEALQLSLSVMERDWHQIDNEWGPIMGVFGDLDGAVTAGKAEGIAEARAAIAKATGTNQ